MRMEFSGEIWFWRGPAPWFFVTVPRDESRELAALMKRVTYGWGMIPVIAEIGATEFKTSLFPKDNFYIVPIKAAVRRAEKVDEGDVVTISLEVDARWSDL